jgi:hypothetical protein
MYNTRSSTAALIGDRVGGSYCELNATRASERARFIFTAVSPLQWRFMAINLKDRPLERAIASVGAATRVVSPGGFYRCIRIDSAPGYFPYDRAFNYCRPLLAWQLHAYLAAVSTKCLSKHFFKSTLYDPIITVP